MYTVEKSSLMCGKHTRDYLYQSNYYQRLEYQAGELFVMLLTLDKNFEFSAALFFIRCENICANISKIRVRQAMRNLKRFCNFQQSVWKKRA